MLRISLSSSSSRAKSYYSSSDYYSEGQELIGRWRGKGARMLGLFGDVEHGQWERLCDNLRPDTGEPLTVRSRSERRVDYDFNFHCPKGVSLLYGITRDERILNAFRDAVDSTMNEIEAEAKTRIRRGGSDEDRATGNLVWGEYVHFTARPEEDVPDPHLHAHCFVFNATFDGEENRWKAAQIGDIKRDAPYFEAVFHAKLARGLEELGLETRRTRTGWDLAAVPPETAEKFSRRTARIEKEAKKRGITDPEEKAGLGAKTRAGKAKEMGMGELAGVWLRMLDAGEARTMAGLERQIGGPAVLPHAGSAREGVLRAIEHSFERASVVPERRLLAEALRQGVGKDSRYEIEAMVRRQGLINAFRNGRRMVTSRGVLEEESRMLAFAREGRGACVPVRAEPWEFHREWLGDEQKAAVRHVLQSRDRVMIVRGRAGTGKTTMTQEVREAIEASGEHVYAFAPSAAASRGVLRQEAGFQEADTVAKLLADRELQAELEGSVIWIDEAGLLGTRTMQQVFELANRLHARVVLSGDTAQHGSVDRGAALRLLEDEAGLKPAEIRNIQRQEGKYRDAVKALSEGRVADGYRQLDKLGWIREVPDDEREQVLAAAYIEAVGEGKTALVVSPSHAEGERIAFAIREQLRDRKLLGKDARPFAQLVPTNFTVGQKRDALSYLPGDVIIYHQNAKGHRKGDQLIAGRDVVPFDQAERFTVYRLSTLELATGDRIRITKNGTTPEGSHRLNNGDLFTVKSFTPSGDIVVDGGRIIPKEYGHLASGFVTTSHSSQGRTVQCVIIGQSADSFPASSQEQFYVSVSRGKKQALVFTDSKEDLLRAVSRSDERLSATELVQGDAAIRHHVIRERLAEQERQAAELAHMTRSDTARELVHER